MSRTESFPSPLPPGRVSFLSNPPWPPISPFLKLSRSSRPPGSHSPLHPGVDILPTPLLSSGQRSHPGKGGVCRLLPLLLLSPRSILFSALPGSPPHPWRGNVPDPALRPESRVQTYGDRNCQGRGRGPASSRRCSLARRRASEGARHPPATRHPALTEVRALGAPTSAGAPPAEARAGSEPRSLSSASRLSRPTWSRAGSRARKRAQLRDIARRPATVAARLHQNHRLRGGGVQHAHFTEEETEAPRGFKGRDWSCTPHPPLHVRTPTPHLRSQPHLPYLKL